MIMPFREVSWSSIRFTTRRSDNGRIFTMLAASTTGLFTVLVLVIVSVVIVFCLLS
jgi:hypothetical protein